jgi:hypothetical protein
LIKKCSSRKDAKGIHAKTQNKRSKEDKKAKTLRFCVGFFAPLRELHFGLRRPHFIL